MSDTIEARIDALLRARRDPACLRIGVAGGSGSGKSTICDLMRTGLQPCAVTIIALDRFFKPTDQLPTYDSLYHGDRRPDFNRPDSLRVDEMIAFCRGVDGADVVIFDSHFGLYYPEIRALMDIKCFVAVDPAEMLDRRTRRNLAIGYGGDRETILNYNRECVLPRYEEFILPTRNYADIVIPNGSAETAERDRWIGALCHRIRTTRTAAGPATGSIGGSVLTATGGPSRPGESIKRVIERTLSR